LRIENIDRLLKAAASQIKDPAILEQLELVVAGKDDIVLPQFFLEETQEVFEEEKNSNLAHQIREMTKN
jgi:hypothetical protein